MPHLTAFILAGGRSSRMGAEKAFLELDGETLLARALALARSITADVRIAGPQEKFTGFAPTVEDVYPGCGPLAGIHAALATSMAELNLMLAVDTPFLQPAFLQHLVQQADACDALVTVPRLGEYWQPLCAVYRRDFAAVAEDALKSGRYKIDALFASVPVRAITEAELREFAFDPAMFDNLNTREDWQRARSRPPSPVDP